MAPVAAKFKKIDFYKKLPRYSYYHTANDSPRAALAQPLDKSIAVLDWDSMPICSACALQPVLMLAVALSHAAFAVTLLKGR